MHSHIPIPPATRDGEPVPPTPIPRGVTGALVVVMSALFVLTVVAMVSLWPNASDLPAKRPYMYEGAQRLSGEVVAIHEDDPDGGITVLLDDTGERVKVRTYPSVPASSMSIGDRVRVVHVPVNPSTGVSSGYAFMDFQRGWPMVVLALIFVAAVIAVARVKGAAALVGLVGALACIWLFLLPAMMTGRSPLLVTLASASAVLFIVVYLAHGISVKSTTALLGTFAGVGIVVLGAWIAIPATHLTPLVNEEMSALVAWVPGVDVAGVLLCGMVLAGVGVLNDVTITQASAVWELRAADPHASRRAIFASAMRIGRDHIASTVYTIAFAYVGGALSMLMLTTLIDYTVVDLLTFEDIAEELVPTFVASIALVLAIPLTTAIGAWLVGPGAVERSSGHTLATR
jgi:uncharacterized membrane protein